MKESARRKTMLTINEAIYTTRRYGSLQPPTSSSYRELVAFGHLEGLVGPP